VLDFFHPDLFFDFTGVSTSDVVETVTSETEIWIKFRDETETSHFYDDI